MKTITGLEILEILEILGELEWVRCSATRGKADRLERSPFVVWRYKTRDINLESLLIKAVESFRGNVEWEIKFTGKNWLIAPKLLEKFQQERDYKKDVDALKAISIEFPEFCQQANEDVPALAAKIKETTEKIDTFKPLKSCLN
ncbi:hypothetical protein [Aphanothece sacrum]|uniref:Uncharacterized protein n=1 Tax=Aphanothece sacrum FPU1 TaxID=1920663 RepID=A0A401ILT1_APHSA|nr:hypothetical protein [Aphanothece sacrum]GBF82220.1 hypothetical protein AsFPU1_3648 [Aphanothece sacrum FPU1]GBF87242.1 mobilization protein [Aphanothece sacrum FPU3]